MTEDWRTAGDLILKRLMRDSLRWGLRWIANVYWKGVTVFGKSSFNTCLYHPLGASESQWDSRLCRHNLARPRWMVLAEDAWLNELMERTT